MLPDLSTFCSKDHYRTHIQKPFSIGDWTYATNGHIAVRVARLPTIPDNTDAPDAEKLFVMFPAGEYQPLPKIDLPKEKDVACRLCDGRGHRHDCPACECTCNDCNGSGFRAECVSVGIKPAVFDAKYIALLQKLPDIELSVTAEMEPARFRFSGGEGALMPLRGARRVHIDAA